MLADVLTAFVDERGLRSQSVQVCSRTAYLFSRFVKNINKVHLQVQQIQRTILAVSILTDMSCVNIQTRFF